DLYTYAAPPDLPAGVRVLDAADIVPADRAPLRNDGTFAAGSMGSFSDHFRYHLLLARGGWWVDMDVVCLRPWRFSQPALTASTDELQGGRIANGFVLRFPPGHPVMAACAAATDRLQLHAVGIDQTGPLLLNRTLTELGQRELMLPPSVFSPVPWNASHRLVQPPWRRFTLTELKHHLRRPHLRNHFTRDTAGLHLWNETWRHAGRDKNARYPHRSLYEQLQRRYNPARS
ncbi:MAG TPA: hypothetical protein VHE13_14530, partial [Opitutus sp.]|nr:hypothetical protein [Opitutus sp.]